LPENASIREPFDRPDHDGLQISYPAFTGFDDPAADLNSACCPFRAQNVPKCGSRPGLLPGKTGSARLPAENVPTENRPGESGRNPVNSQAIGIG